MDKILTALWLIMSILWLLSVIGDALRLYALTSLKGEHKGEKKRTIFFLAVSTIGFSYSLAAFLRNVI